MFPRRWPFSGSTKRKHRLDIIKRLAKAYKELGRVREQNNHQLDAPECLIAENAVLKLRDMVALDERELLRKLAWRWNVYFPSILEDDWYKLLPPNEESRVLKDEKEHNIRSQIFQQKITFFGWVFGALFGASAVIQAFFAVLSYYWPRH